MFGFVFGYNLRYYMNNKPKDYFGEFVYLKCMHFVIGYFLYRSYSYTGPINATSNCNSVNADFW